MSPLDAHVQEMVAHHFSEETGTPFWIERARALGLTPSRDLQSFADLKKLGPFDKSWIRTADHALWVPKAYAHRPFRVFETGGTTGIPVQRPSWDDHLDDYSTYAPHLPDDAFPKGQPWLILGPTGPRRLRLSMEHLANTRGGVAYHVDLDPRWIRTCQAKGDTKTMAAYLDHVLGQALRLLRTRPIRCIFTTPRLLEALGERVSLPKLGITGVLCGGTSMSPQTVRFLVEEVLEGQIHFEPVYGNTLMGLATAEPLRTEVTGDPALPGPYEVVYHAPQPRAVLEIIGEDGAPVPYGQRGRVVLSTLTKEFFMPNLHERDEAIRRPPTDAAPWDGAGDVRPLGSAVKTTLEGVY